MNFWNFNATLRLRPNLKGATCFRKRSRVNLRSVADWSFLTNHARVLLCIAHDPGARLRDIAVSLGITERSTHGIITDLVEAGYVMKQKDGRRNRYQIEADLPLREPASRGPAIGEVLALLLGSRDGLAGLAGLAGADRLDGGPADGADHPERSVSGRAADQRLAQESRDSSAGPSAVPRSVSR